MELALWPWPGLLSRRHAVCNTLAGDVDTGALLFVGRLQRLMESLAANSQAAQRRQGYG